MKTITISITEIELIAYYLAKKLMKFDEPIPGFDTRFPSILESCLATPFQKFGGRFLYEGLVKKAAVLFLLTRSKIQNSFVFYPSEAKRSEYSAACSVSRGEAKSDLAKPPLDTSRQATRSIHFI